MCSAIRRHGGRMKSTVQCNRLDARKVFASIVDHAWRTGEPGVIFVDRVNQTNPTHRVEEIEATNPAASSRCRHMIPAIWHPSIWAKRSKMSCRQPTTVASRPKVSTGIG